MSGTIVFRLITKTVFTRIEVPLKATILQLKQIIEERTQVKPKDQQLFTDQQFKKKINLSDNSPMAKIGLKEGDVIYLKNSEAKSEFSNTEKPKGTCNHSENEVCINCIDKKRPKKESIIKKDSKGNPLMKNEDFLKKSGLTEKCNHAPGQKCFYCLPKFDPKEEIKGKCNHGPGGECPNCVDKNLISNAKHISFDQYINDKKQQCKGTHESSSVCINCMPPAQLSYTKKKNCPNHPPEMCCNKCMPPNAILNRQTYRHVDYVSFMNKEQLDLFLKPWIDGLFNTQRMAYLFGYYAKDPNYKDGVRAIIETIYEPPQIGDQTSVVPQPDQDVFIVDRLAKDLTLECVGWIFTTIKEDNVALTSYDIRKAAKLQQAYTFTHPSGCQISRFITCVVRPNDAGECEIDTYMVSDMCQALERDHIFDELKDKKLMQVRKAKRGEILPTIYMEGKESSKFDPDFFIVNVAHGVPSDKKGQNIIKTYDFPVKSRCNKGIVTQNDVKDYFKKYKNTNANIKCANLDFLIYVAKTLDIETASTFAKQVLNNKIDWDVVQSLLSNYIGY
jgi:nuclear protein localization family protein 4